MTSRFGSLTVIGDGPLRNRHRTWQLRCDCGTVIVARVDHVQGGHTQSCGCLRRALVAALGASSAKLGGNGQRHPLYATWRGMLNRCYNPRAPKFERWGGRGITVCDRWRGADGFAHFVADMGAKPGPEYTLDRRDPDGNYEPSNCRWATPFEQRHNRSAK